MAKKKAEEVVPTEMTLTGTGFRSPLVFSSPPKVIVPTGLTKLSVDYHSEGLNNMARKINEIIDYLDAI